MSKNTPGRPAKYDEESMVFIRTREGAGKLQKDSDRRAIVSYVMENGGSATIKELNAHMNCDVRYKVAALARSGWLEIKE